MKLRKLISTVLATSMLFSTCIVLADTEELNTSVQPYSDSFVAESGVMYIGAEIADSDSNIINAEVGTRVNINFNILQNQGFSSYTFFIKYNPEVVQATRLIEPENYDYTDYITYPVTFLGQTVDTPFYTENIVNKQISLVPSTESDDYAGLADGVKTAAQIGKIKLADYVDASYVNENNHLQEVTGDGIFMTLEFEVMGSGDAGICIEAIDAFKPSPVNLSKVIPWGEIPNSISVDTNVTTTTETTTESTTTESTTETTTETTTESTTAESTTETTTETTTESTTAESTTETTTEADFLYGDANTDGELTASDVAQVLQKALKASFIMTIEEKTSDYLKYIDVNMDGEIGANDAAEILQKVLKLTFKMTVEEQQNP